MIIVRKISLPLDDEGFFRRQCSFCEKEFKIFLTKNELQDLEQDGIGSYLLPEGQRTDQNDASIDDDEHFFCPYCGEMAPQSDWWTQEQLAFFRVHAENYMAKIVNDKFIKPMKRKYGRPKKGFISFHLDAKEIKQKDAWISPEENDMSIIHLPCCTKKMKIDELGTKTVICFFCRFPHDRDLAQR